ncbi:MAG: cytochrome c biogenesis protein CcsA [Planctomycetes bacterium]|nr:cytochrome c biogenesis protein CcsA [Planctomycetota bacterium]
MANAGVTVFCFLASYVVALGLELSRLWRRSSYQRIGILAAALAGLVAHFWYLWIRSTETSLPPLLSSTHDWLLVLAWIAVLFYVVVVIAEPNLAIGLFLLPVVLILIFSANFVSSTPNTLLSGDPVVIRTAVRGWTMLHATLLVFGIAGVVVGFVLSLMYLVQHRRLKQKQTIQSGLRLPSLERLSRLNWWSVILSVPLLTLGMLTGVILGLYSSESVVSVSFSDPVVVVNGATWALMVGFFFWLLRKQDVAGKQVAWRTIWAFGFLLVTLIGLQILTSGGSFSWDTWHT